MSEPPLVDALSFAFNGALELLAVQGSSWLLYIPSHIFQAAETTSIIEGALQEAEVEAGSPVAIRRQHIYDKAFLAVVKAINQLLVKYGYPEPERHGKRFAYLRDLENRVHEIGKADI